MYVPGIDGSGELLLGTEARLETAFRLTRLRYVSEPEVPVGRDRYDRLAKSAVQCMEERGIERALLLADSFGGALSLQMALDHPDSVLGIAIVNGFAHFSKRASLVASRATFALLPKWLFDFSRRHFAPRTLFGSRLDAEVLRRFHALRDLHRGDGYKRRFAMIAGLDLRPRLGELRRPVALFASEGDRVVRSVHAAREMRALLPDATLETLPGSGHLVLPLPDEPWVERVQALAMRVESSAG